MFGKSFLVFFLLLAITHCFSLEERDQVRTWEHYKEYFRPIVGQSEDEYRRLIFERNLARIDAHNADLTQTYKMGVNKFALYTKEQFQKMFLMPINSLSTSTILSHLRRGKQTKQPEDTPIVGRDWVIDGKISPIQNQGACSGGGYAFAAIAALESAYLFKSTAVDLSEQQVIDCSTVVSGNSGCITGDIAKTISYLLMKGSTEQIYYPWVGTAQPCVAVASPYKITKSTNWNGCTTIYNQVTTSPVIVNVEASNWALYSMGVFNSCGQVLDHYVLAVGNDRGVWKLKNSWGTGWGELGFIRLAGGNTCGICLKAGVSII